MLGRVRLGGRGSDVRGEVCGGGGEGLQGGEGERVAEELDVGCEEGLGDVWPDRVEDTFVQDERLRCIARRGIVDL